MLGRVGDGIQASIITPRSHFLRHLVLDILAPGPSCVKISDVIYRELNSVVGTAWKQDRRHDPLASLGQRGNGLLWVQHTIEPYFPAFALVPAGGRAA